jgi:dimethylargininase
VPDATTRFDRTSPDIVPTLVRRRCLKPALTLTGCHTGSVHRQIALVRRPGPLLADGIVTHIEASPVDVDAARRQWEGYVETLCSTGWEIREVAPADDCPDAVFIEDAAVVFDDIAVTTRPGAPSRRAEVEGMSAPLMECGLEVIDLGAGHLDGGDVLKVGRSVFVGLGGRTDIDGIEALTHIIAPRGWTVIAVPVSRVLHLKSAITALPDGTIIGYLPLVDDVSLFDRFRAVDEESGSHVVITGDDRLLMAASAPRTASMLRADGYQVDLVDIAEFEKLEGCVTCLSIRVR